ncbi:2-C-methyl-D-erythritol 4-phosphate cytidylyltransferase [hydrothermal vent metagenome]|uniref:2-C-methyl-D-erythritol 4-phosphate cytidylyltransferase n=1 Tax=hydrothermal vent metagenome TaxID=652676 RepID=A0A1W1DTK5_9ZZZZ
MAISLSWLANTEFINSVFANHDKLIATAVGGKARFHSVLSALDTLRPFAKDEDWVLVHDAALLNFHDDTLTCF